MNHSIDSQGGVLDRFRSYLYLLARAHLHPRHQARIDASDLVQQTLLDAHLQRDRFRGQSEAQLAGWLRKILANKLVDALRHLGRAKRDVARERSMDAAIDESFSRVDQWLAASQRSPSQHVVHREELLRLPDALGELSEAQREAIVLHHLQGLTLAQTAAEIGRSESAVAGLLYRGLKKLHAVLDEAS